MEGRLNNCTIGYTQSKVCIKKLMLLKGTAVAGPGCVCPNQDYGAWRHAVRLIDGTVFEHVIKHTNYNLCIFETAITSPVSTLMKQVHLFSENSAAENLRQRLRMYSVPG